jgi:hypothetical protein
MAQSIHRFAFRCPRNYQICESTGRIGACLRFQENATAAINATAAKGQVGTGGESRKKKGKK